MTRELYERTEALEVKVQAVLDEGVTANQLSRIADRLGVEPDTLTSDTDDDDNGDDDE